MYGLMENHRYSSLMQQELIRDVLTENPKFVVLVRSQMSWGTDEYSDKTVLKWISDYMKGFDRVGLINLGYPIEYLMGTKAANRAPRNVTDYVIIYKRRS
jgi:hypothetical protein